MKKEIRFNSSSNSFAIRIPPNDDASEKALLGSLMLRSDAIYEVLDLVSPDSFYYPRHRIIYETILELFESQTPADIILLSSRLREKGLLENVGGISFITELSSLVPSSANVKHYAEKVMQKYLLRQLIEASEHLSHLGFNEAPDLEETLDSAEKKIYDVTQKFSGKQNFKILKPLLKEAFERFDRLSGASHELRGIPTGFKSLDDILGGFQKADLIILAARPSVGKTAFVLDLARRTAVDHKTVVGIFSLEMTSDQLTDRIVAAQAKINGSLIRKGIRDVSSTWGTGIYSNMSQAIDELMEAKIHIDDQAGNTIMKMRSAARKLKREKGLDLLIVDYLQLIMPSSARANDSTVQQVTEISRGLKLLARELNIPVIALSQLSRQAAQEGTKEPQLHHLRDSGSIEQDADLVMFLSNVDSDDMPSASSNGGHTQMKKLSIAKHRNGPTGYVNFNFMPHHGIFTEIDHSNHGKIEEEFSNF